MQCTSPPEHAHYEGASAGYKVDRRQSPKRRGPSSHLEYCAHLPQSRWSVVTQNIRRNNNIKPLMISMIYFVTLVVKKLIICNSIIIFSGMEVIAYINLNLQKLKSHLFCLSSTRSSIDIIEVQRYAIWRFY